MINLLLEKIFGYMPEWLVVLLVFSFSLLALLMALVISFLLIRLCIRIGQRVLTVWHRVTVANQGNVRGIFRIQAVSAEKGLNFQFYYLDKALPLMSIPEPVVQPPQPAASKTIRRKVSAARPTVETTETNLKTGEQKTPPAGSLKDGVKKSAEETKKKAEGGLGKVRMFSSLLGTLGSLLPGSLGETFKEKSITLQGEAQSASSTIELPEEKLRMAQAAQKQAKNLKPGQSAPAPVEQKPPVPEARSSNLNAQVESRQVISAAAVQAASVPPVAPAPTPTLAKKGSGETFVQSPQVPPDSSLELDLKIDPLHRFRTHEYAYWVSIVQCVDDQAAADQPLEAVRIPNSVLIKGISPLFRVLSIFLSLVVIAVNGLWVILFTHWLTRFIS
jgi:hypothetical protein